MDLELYEDKTFENIDYSGKSLVTSEFLHCIFINCQFQKTELANVDFQDCSFEKCNFSLAVLNNAGLKNTSFTACKLIGIDFSRCSDFQFSVSFQDCILDYSSFFKKKMKKACFTGCSLKEADFAESDLSGAIFNNCDLTNAGFMRTVLEKADFRTAINYSIDPELNRIKKARFSFAGLAGLLAKYDIDIEVE